MLDIKELQKLGLTEEEIKHAQEYEDEQTQLDNYITANPFIEAMPIVTESCYNDMTKEDQSTYDNFSDEIVVYRGCHIDEYNNAEYLQSWTLDQDKAYFFAFEYNMMLGRNRMIDNGVVVKATIDKKHVFAYVSERDEKEVIINPSWIEDDEIIHYQKESQ